VCGVCNAIDDLLQYLTKKKDNFMMIIFLSKIKKHFNLPIHLYILYTFLLHMRIQERRKKKKGEETSSAIGDILTVIMQ
jgi:hypothetical protein